MITHDYQLIFVHVPKCAGRSVCDMFNQRFDHYTARYYETEYKRFWESYRKITIVRNPFDRLVSLYIYLKWHRRHQFEPISCNIAHFKLWLITNLDHFKNNFEPMNAEGNRGTDGDIGSPFWFTSQWQRIIDSNGNANYDLLHKLENGMEPIASYLETITGKRATVPHVNASEYQSWKAFYDNESYAIASQFPPIIEDCARLGYSYGF